MNKIKQDASAQLFELRDFPFDENNFSMFLRTPNERSLVPMIVDKTEFQIWSEEALNSHEHYHAFYEHLGKPAFKPVDNISKAQLPGALQALLGVMNKKEVFLKTFTDVPERELYRFITKELFPSLITDKQWLKPMVLIYEEFHSNEEYGIKKAASKLLRALFGMEAWKYQWKLWKKVLDNYSAIKQFVTSYEGFDVRSIEFDEISSDGEEASILFQANFYAVCNNMVFVHHFEGNGCMELFKNNGSWCARSVTLPNRV